MHNPAPDVYCAAINQSPIMATAPVNRYWVFLEYGGAWGNDVLPDSDLPEEIKTGIREMMRARPGGTLLFIKKERRLSSGGLRLFVAVPELGNPRLYARDLDSYEAVAGLDLDGALSDSPDWQPFLSEEPLVLVCTNGKRDRCCARFGLPVYQNLASGAEDWDVWQCSHLGGHKFAPTALLFPTGMCLGRLDPATCVDTVGDFLRGNLHAAHFRGLPVLARPGQAVLHFLLENNPELKIADLVKVEGTVAEDRHSFDIRFGDGSAFQVMLTVEKLAEEEMESCSKNKWVNPLRFHLSGISRC